MSEITTTARGTDAEVTAAEVMLPAGAAQGIDLLDTATHAPTRRRNQRGMSTAEYAIGILAAVSLALVLLRVVTDNEFFKVLLKVVLKIMDWVADKI
ncbi:DUF4244 domain-containing protein [Propionibacteriaceae bacterium G1746]|uniref:DUF4244 domain-containing protein n=1 Tax=Aestuariimicrobium sp. G57 TaxID=3418485 RepID=UPI003C23F8F0